MTDAEFDAPNFLARLRAGEDRAFRQLIRRYHGALVGTASGIIGSRAQAEEVVQDAWLAVFNGIAKFEGRASLASWIFTIVINRARTRIGQESRLAALPVEEGPERSVDLRQFKDDGHWLQAPRLWDELDPERVYGGKQLWEHVQIAIAAMPASQRAVLVLRDMEGQDAPTACEMLGISPENQRVLLHRARGRVRAAIDQVTTPVVKVRAGAPMLRRLVSKGTALLRILQAILLPERKLA
jgi:RNA polymerase sigma-70 factor (ECF subfamily)